MSIEWEYVEDWDAHRASIGQWTLWISRLGAHRGSEAFRYIEIKETIVSSFYLRTNVIYKADYHGDVDEAKKLLQWRLHGIVQEQIEALDLHRDSLIEISEKLSESPQITLDSQSAASKVPESK